MKQKIIWCVILLTLSISCNSKNELPNENNKNWKREKVNDWQAGYLDIHHISTGRGNCTFFIMPDGTTMLVDAGDIGSKSFQEILNAKPNSSKSPAEWVAQYIKHFTESLNNNGALDYALLTHFHDDHIGGEVNTAVALPGKNYKLSGITELGNLLDINILIDRGYPLYDYYPARDKMISVNSNTLPNYLRYIEERDKEKKTTQMFEVGSNTQITLKKNAGAYSNFEIRNIVGNGKVWTGTGFESKVIIESNQFGGENSASCGFNLQYGKFNYYTGGDIQGENNSGGAYNIETAVSKIIDDIDVVYCNHHAFSDAMHKDFIKATKPKAFIIPVWGYNQPHVNTLNRLLSRDLYPSDRMIFATGELTSTNNTLGENGKQIKHVGHILTRVYEGGDTFQIFVIYDLDQKYEIVYKTDVLSAE